MVRKSQWICILFLVFAMNCGTHPSRYRLSGEERLSYFPVVLGTTWTFSGPYGRVVLVDSSTQLREGRGDVPSEFRLVFNEDYSGPRLQETFVVSEDQIYWTGFILPNLPTIRFDPPLPLLPPSSQVGDSLVVDAEEQWRDSVEYSFAVRSVVTVVAVEDVSVPAGNFEECIRVRQAIFYEDSSVPHLFTSIEFWYAQGIGWVKYDSEVGSGELLTAMIGDNRYP